MSREYRVVRRWVLALFVGLFVFGGYAGYEVKQTSAQLAELHKKARAIGSVSRPTDTRTAEVPLPVQRYFDYVFRQTGRSVSYVELEMFGDFRRPLAEVFEPTTAKQTLVPSIPALVFEASTPVFPGVHATVYDAYLDGEMEMKAKIWSLFTVVDEKASEMLDQISLRRWLLESPLYPQALRPSKYLQWEPVDDLHARAVVSFNGVSANMVATFAEDDGRLVSFHAEQDGDLTTPYHGSGEFVSRSDYREVDGVMIPFRFSVARMAKGEKYPFWKGELTAYKVHYQD